MPERIFPLHVLYLMALIDKEKEEKEKMEREVIEIDWEKIGQISYRSNLGKSLKNTLRKFNKDELIDEIQEVIFRKEMQRLCAI